MCKRSFTLLLHGSVLLYSVTRALLNSTDVDIRFKSSLCLDCKAVPEKGNLEKGLNGTANRMLKHA